MPEHRTLIIVLVFWDTIKLGWSEVFAHCHVQGDEDRRNISANAKESDTVKSLAEEGAPCLCIASLYGVQKCGNSCWRVLARSVGAWFNPWEFTRFRSVEKICASAARVNNLGVNQIGVFRALYFPIYCLAYVAWHRFWSCVNHAKSWHWNNFRDAWCPHHTTFQS